MKIIDYHRSFKYLPIELLTFFSKTNYEGGKMKTATVKEFCIFYKNKFKVSEAPQPDVVSQICDKFVINGNLAVIRKGGVYNMDDSYKGFLINEERLKNPAFYELQNNILSCLIYGFKFTYEYFKSYVKPIQHITKGRDITIGTSFLYYGGLLTAKHCIVGAKEIAIEGISKEILQNSTYLIHPNPLMDLIFIKFPDLMEDSLYFSEEAYILDDVLTLGFPKISGFHNFLTAERANISARFTGTVGSVSSLSEDIFMRENLILITAKIKGGNSGGPIINNRGAVIGVASNIPMAEGNYDDLGYGTVIPISFANEIIEKNGEVCNVSEINFTDFN